MERFSIQFPTKDRVDGPKVDAALVFLTDVVVVANSVNVTWLPLTSLLHSFFVLISLTLLLALFLNIKHMNSRSYYLVL